MFSFAENVLHPDRIIYPMKRAGRRGENKWEKSLGRSIRYDCYQENEIAEKYGPETIAYIAGTGREAVRSSIR
jgi:hypothetical protein